MRTFASACIHDGDDVRANYYPAHDVPMTHGEPLHLPASIHVHIGAGLELWGSPEVVLRTLCEALARAREAETAGQRT